MGPEEKARQIIDRKLEEAGWVIQDLRELNPIASLGVAVREYQTVDQDEVDYALFIDGTPVGVIEAKPDEEGVHLVTAAHEQNERYVNSGLKWANYSKKDMRFVYQFDILKAGVILFDVLQLGSTIVLQQFGFVGYRCACVCELCTEETFPLIVGKLDMIEFLQLLAEISNQFFLGMNIEILISLRL